MGVAQKLPFRVQNRKLSVEFLVQKELLLMAIFMRKEKVNQDGRRNPRVLFSETDKSSGVPAY